MTGSTLKVNFGANNFSGSFTFGIKIDGMQNNFAGGLNNTYNSTAKFTANACGGSYSLYGQGFLAGPAAARAGMAYHVSGSISTNIHGVVAYKKQ